MNETGIGGQANANELEDGNEKKSSDSVPARPTFPSLRVRIKTRNKDGDGIYI